MLEGGCQCGDVRYRVAGEPVAVTACHCTECQRQSGSAFAMSMIVPRAAFRLTGETRSFTRRADSGAEVECLFCPRCGTRIYHVPASMPATLNVKPGTLDDTAWLEPVLHVWTASKQPWTPIPAGVATAERNPRRPRDA